MSHHYIRFDKVSYSYPSGVKALDSVSFTIHHGEKVAVVGTNGAGKSTMMLLVGGLLMATSGRVVIGDIPVTRKTLPQIRRTVGLVFQNPDDQLFMPTVADDVAFGPANMKLPQEEIERRVEKALRDTGAWDLRDRAPYTLSGGQKRSVAIATVLSMEPDILVLDEPSSNLDPHARRLLMKQFEGFSHTCLITTHDIDMVRRLCTRTLVMHDGRLLADGPTDEIFGDADLLARASL